MYVSQNTKTTVVLIRQCDVQFFFSRTDHTRGVSTMTLFPKSGHLVLSAGMDASVRVNRVINNILCTCIYNYMQGLMQWLGGSVMCSFKGTACLICT